MIATEDDAAMALQISNALTQALLKYRLMNAPKEVIISGDNAPEVFVLNYQSSDSTVLL